MEPTKHEKRERIMEHMIDIPGNLIALHGHDNLAEFVLQHLAHKKCFNLNKAAYFIDNPDFDHFKGIAGYTAQEAYADEPQKCWHNPHHFTQHMQASAFNQQVRNLKACSPKKNKQKDEHIAQNIAHELKFNNPQFCCLTLKNDNHGLFIFEETNNGACAWKPEDLKKGLDLLAFCPVF